MTGLRGPPADMCYIMILSTFGPMVCFENTLVYRKRTSQICPFAENINLSDCGPINNTTCEVRTSVKMRVADKNFAGQCTNVNFWFKN